MLFLKIIKCLGIIFESSSLELLEVSNVSINVSDKVWVSVALEFSYLDQSFLLWFNNCQYVLDGNNLLTIQLVIISKVSLNYQYP